MQCNSYMLPLSNSLKRLEAPLINLKVLLFDFFNMQ